MDRQLNALILDDSENDALLLLRELRRGGFEVDYILVDNAEEMLAALRERKWDIILSDYSMPSFNALDALKIAQDQGLDLPFIIVSGTVGEDAAVAAMKAGANDFFAKGKLTRLVPAVERELREAAGRRKRTEAEARFTTAFHRSPVGTIITRLSDGKVLDANARFAELYGLSLNEIIGKTASDFDVWPKPEIAQQLGESGSVSNIEIEFYNAAGRRGYALLSAEIIELNNEMCVLSMVHNITERIEAERNQERYVERLALLHEIDRAILMADQPQMIAQVVLSRLQESMGFDSASVTVFDGDHRDYKVLASIAPIDDYRPYDDKSVLEVLKQNTVYRAEDLLSVSHPSPSDRALITAGIRSYVRIPLMAGSKLLGSFNLKAMEPRAFSGEEVDIAREVASQLAIAIENARLLELELRRNQELTALQQASLQVTGSLDTVTVLHTLLDYATSLIHANDAHIFLYDGATLTFGAARWEGKRQTQPMAEPRQGGLTYTVARSGQRVVIPDVNQHPIYNEWKWGGGIIGLPLRVGGEINGVMSLAFNDPHHFDDDEIRLLELLADQAAIAIHNAQLYQQIRSYADGLEQRVLERTEELQASEAKYRALIEFAPDPIVIVNESGLITLANNRAEESFGYLQHELINQSIEILLPGRLSELNIDQLTASEPSSRASALNLDLAVRHKNGDEIPVKVGLSPIRTGTETLVMAYMVDITADKHLEASLRAALAHEKELNELKTSFTSIVSHEFRTPLSVILSSTDLLTRYSDRMDQTRRQEKLDNIARQVKRLIKLMDDVLTITRADSKGFDFRPSKIDLVSLCEEIIEEVRVGYQEVNIDFTYQCDPPVAEIDEFLFSHILQNLASNAIKYSNVGGTVHIQLTSTRAAVNLRVEDQGIGIPVQHQNRLFEAFNRASNVGQIQGTGVGLTIVKRAVDAHRGTIEFQSVEGQGTTFTIHLPVTSSPDQPPADGE